MRVPWTSRWMPAAALLAMVLLGCTSRRATPPLTTEGPPVAPVSAGESSPERRVPTSTYYVSPNGNNADPGTRQAPWATPGYGSRQLQPGDRLVILGGRYVLSQYDDDVITPPSGTPEHWVVIQGEEASRPILVGRDNLAMAINLSGVNYVRIENLEITHDDAASGAASWFRDGIAILDEPASHIVMHNLYIHHLDEFGMNFQDVGDLQISECRIEYCGFGAMGGPEALFGGWQNVTIRRCELSYSGHYYQGGDGSGRPYDRPDGLGVEPSDGPIEIADTVAEHNYGDGLDSKVRNTTIRRCVVANNSCDGVKLWGGGSRVENTLIYGRGDGSSDRTPWAAIVIGTEEANARFDFVNVTVDDTLGHNHIMYVQYDEPKIPVILHLQNTVFRATGPSSHIFIGQASQLNALHNLFYLPASEAVLEHGAGLYTSETIRTLGTGNLYADPRFVAPAWGSRGDYHLQAGSPAINSGLAEGAPIDDLDGLARDVPPDIGAYEWRPGQARATLAAWPPGSTAQKVSAKSLQWPSTFHEWWVGR